MSTELLEKRDEEVCSSERDLEQSKVVLLGRTVFEALAADASSALEVPEGMEDIKYNMSGTRIDGGNWIKDEQ